MRKNYLLVLLLVAMVAFVGCEAKVAEALEDFEYDKTKVVVSVEGSYEKKAIDDVKLIGLTVGSSIGGNITILTEDVALSMALVKLGYKITDNTTPYLLLGVANLGFKQDYSGAISFGSNNYGTTLLRQDYDEAGLAYGLGIEGDLAQYKGVVIGYDARYIHTSGEESDEYIKAVPDLISGLQLKNNVETAYDEASFTLLVSKEIPLNKEATETEEAKEGVVDSITPFIGYRGSLVSMSVESKAALGCIGISNEANFRKVSNNAILGAKVQVNDDIDVKLAGVFGNDLGGSVAASFSF